MRAVADMDRADYARPAVDGDIIAYDRVLLAEPAYYARVLKEGEVAADPAACAYAAGASVGQEEAGADLGWRLDAGATEAADEPAQYVGEAEQDPLLENKDRLEARRAEVNVAGMRPVSEAVVDDGPPLPAKGKVEKLVDFALGAELGAGAMKIRGEKPEHFAPQVAVLFQVVFEVVAGAWGPLQLDARWNGTCFHCLAVC
jgi:hypothetical protein